MILTTGQLWLVGQVRDNGPWEVQGIFDSHEKAMAACKNNNYFIGPLKLNEEITDMTMSWPCSSFYNPNENI